MKSPSYKLPSQQPLLRHLKKPVMYYQDHARGHRDELLAHVASGDYFVTLATTLDVMADDLKAAHRVEGDLLQNVIDDLLFLQQRFAITKR